MSSKRKPTGSSTKGSSPARTVPEFLERLAKIVPESSHGKLAAFRGESDATWKLVPGIARPPFDPSKSICRDPRDDNDLSFERRVLRFFPDHAHPHLPAWFFLGGEVEVRWRTIAVAQHYRLPTRLLDWTSNPLVALYFAVAGNQHKCKHGPACAFRSASGMHHAVVHVLKDRETFSIASLATSSPRPPLYNGRLAPGLIRPPDIDARIIAQGSLFSISKDPATPLLADHAILIDTGAREAMLRELDRLGISRKTIFPGLEGLCDYLDWSSQFWEPNPGRLRS